MPGCKLGGEEVAVFRQTLQISMLRQNFDGRGQVQISHGILSLKFYARKQLLLSARLSHHNSVCPSVRHMGGSVKSGAS